MNLEQAKQLIPEQSYIRFAGGRYKVAGLFMGSHIEIYDEPPSLHVDRILIESCELSETITIESIKKDIESGKCTKIFYSAGTLWWTHLDEDLIQATEVGKTNRENFHNQYINDPNVPQEKKNEAQSLWDMMNSSPTQTPMDPSGCPLYEATKPLDWILAAEQNPKHFGKHELVAFIKTHHQNCDRLIYRSWNAVNEKMDKDAAKS